MTVLNKMNHFNLMHDTWAPKSESKLVFQALYSVVVLS